VYHGLQNCTDVPNPVPGFCTEMCLAASDMKVEEDSVIPEEDPLSVTSPATKGEEVVSYIQQTAYSMALGGPRWYRKYSGRIGGWIWAVLIKFSLIFSVFPQQYCGVICIEQQLVQKPHQMHLSPFIVLY